MITAPKTNSTRTELTKLSISIIVLLALIVVASMRINHELTAVIVAVIFLPVIPVVLLLSIDASRAIRCDESSSLFLKRLGFVLSIPQVLIAAGAITIGIVYPISGIPDFVRDISKQNPHAVYPLVWTIASLFLLGGGILKLREWITWNKRKNKSGQE